MTPKEERAVKANQIEDLKLYKDKQKEMVVDFAALLEQQYVGYSTSEQAEKYMDKLQ